MINRVLVGVDFSEASKIALQRATGWAARMELPLVALHVMQPPAPMLPEAQIALPDPAWLNSLEIHAREQLDALLEEITDRFGKLPPQGQTLFDTCLLYTSPSPRD